MAGYLDGLMLGDGSLSMHGKLSARLQVGRQLAHAEYNEWVMQVLPDLTWQKPWCHVSTSVIEGRKVQGAQHRIRSRCSRELTTEYLRWYPIDSISGKRIRAIPKDFKWTPEALAVAMMDDGSISALKTKGGPTPKVSLIAQLYVCNFSTAEVLNLAQGIRDTFNLKCSVQSNRQKPIISFSGVPQVTRLAEIIEPWTKQVSAMAYKFDLDGKVANKLEQLRAA